MSQKQSNILSRKYQKGLSVSYRDRVYIVKDIIFNVAEYGELNQTVLISFCGLNLNKHQSILEKMQYNGLVARKLMNCSLQVYA